MLIEPVANTIPIFNLARSVRSLTAHLVVAGYRTFGNTGLGGSRYTGFAIRPGSQARELATYADSYASKFYTDRATRLELLTPVSPADAGTLSLLATMSLDMRGRRQPGVVLRAGAAGRAEVAATNLEVVNTVTPGSNFGAGRRIGAQRLESWRAMAWRRQAWRNYRCRR